MENEKIKVGIIGLGLIGGSVLKGLFDLKKYYLTAVSKSSYKKAKMFADFASDDISDLAGSDIVFVCSKMSDTNKVLRELEEILDEKTVVCDVSSIKGFLKDDFKFNFIPTHPMAGTEFSGFENSFKELFINSKWIIAKNNPILEEIIKDLGAKAVIINKKEHDEYTGVISHLPMVLALSLFDCADDEAKKIAASGFRDMTRLSMTNVDLAFDMLKFNKENIEKAYNNLIKSYNKIINMDEAEFRKFSSKVSQERAKMYDKNGKNTLC